MLHDNRTCKALNEPENEVASLIFANSIDIRHIYLNGTHTSDPNIPTQETLGTNLNILLHNFRTLEMTKNFEGRTE